MGIEQQQDGIAHNGLAPLVQVANQITGQPHPKTAHIAGIPGLLGHLLARGIEPGDILDARAMNGAVLEELAALEDRLGAPEMDDGAHKVAKGLLLLGQLPMQPGEVVVLAIGIVVALLRMAELVTGQEHGHALRQEQRSDEVALLLPAQGIDGGIIRRPLGAAVPTVVVVGPVLVIFPIGLVVFVVVADQVMQREAVVAGDEIDAGIGLAPVVLIQVTAAAQTGGKFRQRTADRPSRSAAPYRDTCRSTRSRARGNCPPDSPQARHPTARQ